RRHRHDVPEHGHERTKLVRPDRVERDENRLPDLVHAYCVVVREARDARDVLFCCRRTPSPSANSRTDANGPVITWSPAFSPSVTSKNCSPATPVLSGVNTALPSWKRNTPSVSLRVCPSGVSTRVAVWSSADRLRRGGGSRTSCPASV